MRIEEASALLTAVTTARVQTLLASWRVGQVLEAVVERVPDVGRATLNVNKQSVDIATALSLPVGARLTLEVTQTSPTVVLRLLPPTSEPAPNATSHPATAPPRLLLDDAMRTLIPRQPALAPALARIVQLLSIPVFTEAANATRPPAAPTFTPQPATTPTAPVIPPPPLPRLPREVAERLPPQVLELARKVLDRLPTSRQLRSPEELQRAVRDAGPFFERKLATGTALDIERDLKGALMQLLAGLRNPVPPLPTPLPGAEIPKPEFAPRARIPTQPRSAAQIAATQDAVLALLKSLESETDTALARLTLQQLVSLPKDETEMPQWIFDLPVRHGERVDVFHLHIFRDKHPRDTKHPPAWYVRLSFDLVTLGAVSVLVTWYARTISISLWAQQPETRQRFEQHLAGLRDQLRESGLNVTHLHCETGEAPFARDPTHSARPRRLLDERA